MELQNLFGHLLDSPGDAESVHRAHGVQRLKHHQVEGALKNLGLSSFGHSIGEDSTPSVRCPQRHKQCRVVHWGSMRFWLRVSVLAGFLAFTAEAVDWKALKPQGYVSDFAHVIDANSRAQ